mmetsp:Transcript_138958/g.196698  ORF Transcript_138958/g.196698 Transcript_138958/m.196698 type:complete len:94 (+) Transcript_138958:852-1133(+)
MSRLLGPSGSAETGLRRRAGALGGNSRDHLSIRLSARYTTHYSGKNQPDLALALRNKCPAERALPALEEHELVQGSQRYPYLLPLHFSRNVLE